MKASLQTHNANKQTVGRLMRGPRLVLPALAVLGAGGHASALELGDIAVQSALGEPLRASIAYALNPREELQSYCIYLKAGPSASGLPSFAGASVAVSNGVIRLRGQSAVGEPILALQLTIDCPYAAHLSREYVVFVDPRAPLQADAAAETTPAALSSPQREEPAKARPARERPAAASAPIAASASYRVQRGDTLSGIAERIGGRNVTIWEAVDLLFAANPGAFIDNDRNLLKAGSLLVIPASLHLADGGRIDARPAGAETSTIATTDPRSGNTTAYPGYRGAASGNRSARSAASPASAAATAAVPQVTDVARPEAGDAGAPPTANEAPVLRPGDIATGAGGPFVSPIDAGNDAAGTAAADASPFAPAGTVIPDTAIEIPAAARSTAQARGAAADGGAWSWLMWLGGSGMALILGLLLFGRPLKRRFGRRRELIFDQPPLRRRRSDVAFADEPLTADRPEAVDFRFDDARSATIVNLDGDLDAGTGFQDSGDIDVAQDFGFSASGDIRLGLDVEFPEESAPVPEVDATDMIPPVRRPHESILESEIPPSDEESGEYDVSMIVDATRQPIGDNDETAKDLRAIELDSADAGSEEDPYTLSREVDYKILEQDYHDELTATQALNADLARAARDLLENSGDGTDGTAELPQSRSGAADETPAGVKHDIDDSEDTNINEELKDLPAAENDATAEMEIEAEPAPVRKKRKAS